MSKPLPKGFVCLKCQKEHRYPLYVYAHWGEVLYFTCDCGTKYGFGHGIATSGWKKAKAILEPREESK